MSAAFILIISISFIYTLYLQIFSMDEKRVAVFSKILFYGSLIGAVSCIASIITFYVRIDAVDNADLYGTVRGAFAIFAFPIGFWSVVVLAVTTIAHFVGKKIAAVIPSVCHLSSLLVLLWTLIFASLAHYDEIALNVYFNMVGCSISLITLFPAALGIKKFAKKLSDKDYVYSRLHRYDEKHRKIEERKRIKETKNRIKNKTKK